MPEVLISVLTAALLVVLNKPFVCSDLALLMLECMTPAGTLPASWLAKAN